MPTSASKAATCARPSGPTSRSPRSPGRAGRGAKPGEVLIQTRHPEASVIAALAAGDRDAFYAAETEARRHAGAPPFGRWAAIIVSSEDEAEAREAARAHRRHRARPATTS